ncbi:MAG TPA: hypothetical protein VGE10_06780 [Zeimonas sp.]
MSEFPLNPEEYARTAQEQRDYLRDIADQIERGESLDAMARAVVAVVLRAHAERIPDSPKRGRGRVPRINPSDVALEFEAMMRNPHVRISKFAAYQKLAARHDVSEEAIRQALAKKGADAAAFFDSMGIPSK